MKGLHIAHLEWTPGERREVALVIVSTEAASMKDFMKYARGLIARQKLDRIVVDECHLDSNKLLRKDRPSKGSTPCFPA